MAPRLTVSIYISYFCVFGAFVFVLLFYLAAKSSWLAHKMPKVKINTLTLYTNTHTQSESKRERERQADRTCGRKHLRKYANNIFAVCVLCAIEKEMNGRQKS